MQCLQFQVLLVPRHWWHYVESIDPITISINSWIELVFFFLCHGDVALPCLHGHLSLACQVQHYWVFCIQRLEREVPLCIHLFLKSYPRFQIWSPSSAEITCRFTSVRQTIKHKLNFSCPISYRLTSFVLNRGQQNSNFTSRTCLHAKLN